MKVQVWFKNWHLGEMTSKGDKIVYNSNLKGEKEFFEQSYSTQFYTLYNSQNKILETLPSIIADYLEMANYKIYRHMFEMDEKTSSFDRLYNIGTLSLDTSAFYIKSLE